jgi:glycerol kinase
MARNDARARRGGGSLILAIDQGTTQNKAFVFNARLSILGEAARELPQHFPRPGWVEHDLDDIYEGVLAAVKDAVRRARVEPHRIAAIGITNQRETTGLWKAGSGKPAGRAIVWQDRRTSEDCARLKKRGLEGLFRKRTGLVLDPYFSGTKIAWMLRESPGLRREAERRRVLFGTMDTWLTWKLTGGESHVTDPSNASRTLLMDLETCAWHEDLLEALRVPREMLPEIRDNDSVFGHTRGLGFLPDGIPIASLIGDQQSALFGHGCHAAGEAKCTYGTGAFLVANTGRRIARSRHGLLSTAAWKLGGKATYALEGSTFIAGAIVQWLRDGLGILRASRDVEALARSVEDSGGVSLVPALAGLGAPHWDPRARGLISGITRGTRAGHVARAALEGIAFQVRDLVDALEKDLGRKLRGLRVDGGAAENDLLMQFQADVLGSSVLRPAMTSSTAAGTALLASLTAGVIGNARDLAATAARAARSSAAFEPRMGARERAAKVELWHEAVARARL